MSNDVCESWEDILKEETTLNQKVENLKLNESDKINDKINGSVGTSARETTQCNGNSIKIMKRNKKPTKQVIDLDTLVAMCGPTSNISTSMTMTTMTTTNGIGNISNGFPKSQSDLSNYVHSEPFVPQNNRNVQVSFEDNSRTLFVANQGPKLPTVKILQRPKSDASHNSGQNNLTKNGLALKSFQEREKEYAKARLRILGSAVPNYEEKDLKEPIMANGTSSNREESLMRQPQGPTSSSARGFSVRR